jgi:hypothetical protein
LEKKALTLDAHDPLVIAAREIDLYAYYGFSGSEQRHFSPNGTLILPLMDY